jgi:hypothetical protein
MKRDDQITNREQQDQNINWRVLAYACAGVLWAIAFALLCWLCGGVNHLQQDMAVVKQVLHIGQQTAALKP